VISPILYCLHVGGSLRDIQIHAWNHKTCSCMKHTGQMHPLHFVSGLPEKTAKGHCLIWQPVQDLAHFYVVHVCDTCCQVVTRNYSWFFSCSIYCFVVMHQQHLHFSWSCVNPKPCHCSNQTKPLSAVKMLRHFLFPSSPCPSHLPVHLPTVSVGLLGLWSCV
jgi:hypothetical protein